MAKLGKGFTLSNPLVGSVLVHNHKIIGEGYHQKYGGPHAEINCLESVAKAEQHLIPSATLYVNLEPCNHTGKTPPCSHAIIKAGIKKVIIGTKDYNPIVHSKGIQYLKKNNVAVEVGFQEMDCLKLNKVFFTNQVKQRPYVKLKWAQSANGFIGIRDEEIAISGSRTNTINHKYRAETDAILVGYHTILADQPQLSNRHWQGKQPIRVFIDWDASIPTDQLIKKDQRTIVLNLRKNKKHSFVEYIQIKKTALSVLSTLFENGIISIIVEGGSKTHQMFIDANLWDEAIILSSNKEIAGNISSAVLNNTSSCIKSQNIGTDVISQYSNSPFLT